MSHQIKQKHINDCHPNFYDKDGRFYLVKCFACGCTENYLPAVASGQCAWCGWKYPEEKENKNGK